jgi:predicted amidohydrolase YtcJ
MMPDLDAISKVHPILVYYINMHTAAGNSAAFAAAQIPDDIGPLPGGGRFGRDASGKLNGMIYEESALKKFAIAIPKITPELAGKAVVDWLKVNASFGNTSVHEAGVRYLQVHSGDGTTSKYRHRYRQIFRLQENACEQSQTQVTIVPPLILPNRDPCNRSHPTRRSTGNACRGH